MKIQKVKDKYHILTYIYGIQKDGTDEIFLRHRHGEQTYRHGWGGERKERVRCMKRVTWKLTLPYVKQTANGNLLYMIQRAQTGAL